jgi:signal transduction histidine kinase
VEPVKTYFAPSERADKAELDSQLSIVSDNPVIQKMFDSMPVLVAILNCHRQIVYANKAFKEFFKSHNIDSYIGLRPGEAVHCKHACDNEGGCGTSVACSVCGAVNAILLSQKTGSASMECRITLESGDPLDLLVYANQSIIGNSEFTVFAASDISDQHRRKALERIFFHDLLNITGALKGFLEILNDAPLEERDDYIHFSQNITEHLIEEILAQKELSQAEDSELQINLSAFTALEILNETVLLYERHLISMGKIISIAKNIDDYVIKSDRTLLRRVLGNLLKNALEASSEKDEVILDCKKNGRHLEFSIQNKNLIPPNIQLQIFQRSFSTKGKGRGLGTYSVKLLTERYLAGSVWFTSNPESGTTFYVKIPIYLDE